MGKSDELDAMMDLFVQTLHEIAASSNESETVRLAFSALSSTVVGREYLAEHPVTI